jgi:CheY-like chemotaxis protein
MFPCAPALPMQKADAPSFKFGLNATNIAPVARPEFSKRFRLEQNPSSAIGREEADSPLIYVVDDEPRLTDLYTIILETKGYTVRAFSNRIEGLAELKGARKKPDLLIMDYLGHSMPVDGFMRLCLQAHPNLRILVASGFSQVDARFSYIRPDRFIQKPFTAEEFLQEVQAALAV